MGDERQSDEKIDRDAKREAEEIMIVSCCLLKRDRCMYGSAYLQFNNPFLHHGRVVASVVGGRQHKISALTSHVNEGSHETSCRPDAYG
jgi:hypothetical protein